VPEKSAKSERNAKESFFGKGIFACVVGHTAEVDKIFRQPSKRQSQEKPKKNRRERDECKICRYTKCNELRVGCQRKTLPAAQKRRQNSDGKTTELHRTELKSQQGKSKPKAKQKHSKSNKVKQVLVEAGHRRPKNRGELGPRPEQSMHVIIKV